ncbi:MAG TPA: amidohydrolase family protein [Candidatus Baltobacteraceae bacterium]|nr:amidohydrolase family protein [Candidatus Baltobacteraceae bacterium]
MSLRSVHLPLRRIVLLGVSLGLLTVPGARGQGGEPRTFAIRGAKVVPVSSAPIENATVVVSRGIITAVGTNVTIPPDAWVIDGKGLTVYPGLIDGFTDVGVAAAPAPASTGDGSARPQAAISRGPEDRPATTPWRIAADEVNPSDPRVETWRAAGFTTVIAAPKGGMFPGQASVLDLGGERAGDFVVKSPVAIPVSLQAPGGFRSFPGSVMGGIAYVRQVWLDTKWDVEAEAAYENHPRGVERPKYDRSDAALAAAYSKLAVFLIPGNTSLQIRRSLRLIDEWKLPAVLYGAQMSYDVAPEIAANKRLSVLVDLKWPEAEKDSDPEAVPSLRTLRFRDRAPSSPSALGKAGVKFAFYSGGITAPKDILPAVKKSIDAGLSPDAALRALTLSPAEIFGVAETLGSIETGKIANLVVTDGDLFDKKTKVKIVFVDGRKYEVRETLRPTEPPKGDLTGKWKLSFTTPQGQEEATADLAMQPDGTLTGSVASDHGTGSVFSGWVSGEKFRFVINISIEGSSSDVVFTGTFEGTSMKGSIQAAGYNLEFTGTKPSRMAAVQAGGAQ